MSAGKQQAKLENKKKTNPHGTRRKNRRLSYYAAGTPIKNRRKRLEKYLKHIQRIALKKVTPNSWAKVEVEVLAAIKRLHI